MLLFLVFFLNFLLFSFFFFIIFFLFYVLSNYLFLSFRYRSYRIKLNRAVNRDEKFTAKAISEHRPDYNLDHLVRERYPTFLDALHDLDDSLSLIYAYAHHAQSFNGIYLVFSVFFSVFLSFSFLFLSLSLNIYCK